MDITINEKTGEYTIKGKIITPLRRTKNGKSILLDTTRGTVKGGQYKGHDVRLNVNITVADPAIVEAKKKEAEAAEAAAGPISL